MGAGKVKAQQAVASFVEGETSASNVINSLFPNEESLADLEECITELESQLQLLDDSIRHDLHSKATIDALKNDHQWNKLGNSIDALVEDVCATASKVLDTRKVADDIAAGIKILDRGKENLTKTIAALQRLIMLDSSLKSLTEAGANRDYKKGAQLVGAINSLSAAFEDQKDKVKGVAQVLKEKDALLADLRRQVIDDLNTIEDTMSAATVDPKDYCFFADALSPSIKDEVLMNISLTLLEPYKRNFTFIAPGGSSDNRVAAAVRALETIERRFLWLKRALSENESRFEQMFPAAWNPSAVLAVQFTIITRQQLVSILDVCATNVDPSLLIKILQKTKAFERTLDQDFETQRSLCQSMVAPIESFDGSISRVFDSFLGGWCRKDESNLDAMMSRFASQAEEPVSLSFGHKDDTSLEDDVPRRIFPSALELFRALKELQSQSEAVGSDQMGRDIMRLSKKYIKNYLAVLYMTKIPQGFLSQELNPTLKEVAKTILRISDTEDDDQLAIIARDMRLKNCGSQDVESVVITCATAAFIENSLAAFESLLRRRTTGEKGGLKKCRHLAWCLKVRCNRVLLCHFCGLVLESKMSKAMIEACANAKDVLRESGWVASFLEVWHDYHVMILETLSPSHGQYLLECCGIMVVAQMGRTIACELAPLTTDMTEQLLLDSSTLVEGISKKFGGERVEEVVKYEMQAVATMLKILRTSFASVDIMPEMSTAPLRLMWSDFLIKGNGFPVIGQVLESLMSGGTVVDRHEHSSDGVGLVELVLRLRSSKLQTPKN